MKHTPGPWWANIVGEVGTVPDMYVKICSRVSGTNPDEAKANARLIAAAPMLLAALEHVSDTCHNEPVLGFDIDVVYKAIEAAGGEI